MSDKDILDFLAEVGKLKQVKRSGWWMVGIPYEESVAEHSFRCAAIGYVLAKLEGADPYKVLMMTLFNDLHEARINDLHKVAHKYLNVREAEKRAYFEQVEPLEEGIKEELTGSKEEYDAQETPESLVARDADILECLIQAKEYTDLGFRSAEKFFKQAPGHLRTESARRLWESTKNWDSNAWWEKLGVFER
ncbi:MAG: HD domain-containing protein [Candidatus Omnitrophota bacterium]|nr:HD domain-containing protein [Candidatus Omnitrophota bacterium]